MKRRELSSQTRASPPPPSKKAAPSCFQDDASTITIDSLPAEMLVRIIQALPWPDRVRIERVSPRWRQLALTRGWDDVWHFDENLNEFNKAWPAPGYYDHTAWRIPLLARIG